VNYRTNGGERREELDDEVELQKEPVPKAKEPSLM